MLRAALEVGVAVDVQAECGRQSSATSCARMRATAAHASPHAGRGTGSFCCIWGVCSGRPLWKVHQGVPRFVPHGRGSSWNPRPTELARAPRVRPRASAPHSKAQASVRRIGRTCIVPRDRDGDVPQNWGTPQASRVGGAPFTPSSDCGRSFPIVLVDLIRLLYRAKLVVCVGRWRCFEVCAPPSRTLAPRASGEILRAAAPKAGPRLQGVRLLRREPPLGGLVPAL